MILAIDDLRVCEGADIVVRSLPKQEVQSLLRLWGYKIKELWLDHDLGEGRDIRPTVKFIEEYHEYYFTPDMKIKILSDNPAGRKYIQQALEKYFEVIP
jgi:hypothetical protein